jgi:tetratricopeptide (TPR) repeat protein
LKEALAVKQLRKSRSTDELYAYLNARYLFFSGQFDAAESAALKQLKVDPKSEGKAKFYNILGARCAMRKDYKKAISWYEKAIENFEAKGERKGSALVKSNNSTGSGFDIAGMMNASYEISYTLDQEFKVEIRTKEKKKKKEEVVNMDMFYGKGCYMMGMQDEEGRTVPMKTLMDLKNNSSLMLNDEEMTGMAISMDFMTDKISEAIENDQDSTDVNYTFTKTGKTKMIAGYSSDEYLIETDESTMNVWYTDDITIDIHDNMSEFSMFGSFSGAMANTPKGQAAGMMMESHMVEKTGKQGTFDYIVKEVNLVPSTVNIGDYTMGMGGM